MTIFINATKLVPISCLYLFYCMCVSLYSSPTIYKMNFHLLVRTSTRKFNYIDLITTKLFDVSI
jgi:hypothetical protein